MTKNDKMTAMSELTPLEEIYFQDMLDGKSFGVHKLRVLVNAVNEGRFKLDLSDPKVKAWDDEQKNHLAHMEVWSLQGKRERKIPLSKEDVKILEDYEKNGVLPTV